MPQENSDNRQTDRRKSKGYSVAGTVIPCLECVYTPPVVVRKKEQMAYDNQAETTANSSRCNDEMIVTQLLVSTSFEQSNILQNICFNAPFKRLQIRSSFYSPSGMPSSSSSSRRQLSASISAYLTRSCAQSWFQRETWNCVCWK